MKKIFLFLGRSCLSLVFINSVINHILNWDRIQPYFIRILHDWNIWMLRYPAYLSQFEMGTAFLRSYASLVIMAGVIFAGLGSVAVFLGMRRLGSFLLLLYLIPEVTFTHAFWLYSGSTREVQMNLFLNNIGILGGILILACSRED